jgi:hypothetical protein
VLRPAYYDVLKSVELLQLETLQTQSVWSYGNDLERRESLVDGRVFLSSLFFFSYRFIPFFCALLLSCRAVSWSGGGREGERLDIPTVTVFRTSSFSYYSLSLSVVGVAR